MPFELLRTIEEKLDPAHTALLVVDVQNDFAAPGGYSALAGADLSAAEAVAEKLAVFADETRKLGMPVIHVRAHYDEAFTGGPMADKLGRRPGPSERCVSGTWGADFYRVTPKAGEHVISKHRYSAFVGTDLEMILRREGIRTLVVGGLTTNVCVESTVRDAFNHDFYVVVLSDGTGSPNQESHERSLGVMGAFFGEVMTSNEVLGLWQTMRTPVTARS